MQPRKEKNSEAWDGMYRRLLAFRAANSHDIVTKAADKQLHEWIRRQRYRAKKGKMLDE
jgi:hypothetical protein